MYSGGHWKGEGEIGNSLERSNRRIEFEIAEKKCFFHIGTAEPPVSTGNRPASLQGEEGTAALPKIIHQVSQKYFYHLPSSKSIIVTWPNLVS
jgi:hypothetical protein